MSVQASSLRAFCLLLLLACPGLGRAGAAVYPFPQNQNQPYPAYYPAYQNADIVAVYNSWKADQVTSAGAGGFRRVQRNGDVTLAPLSTVSEGIAYGMIIAVYMNDQPLFDDLWRYHNLHLDGNGLMNWYISADGNTTLGGGAASDADQDIAWALVMAHYQWTSSAALPQPYMTYAQDMITKIWTHEVEKPSMVFRNGDGWGGAATLNVSYFDPSMYRVFAQVSGNPGWYDVIDQCYVALFNSLNATNGNQNNGLVPAWSNLAGQPVVAYAGAPTHFQYDSCRTPFRIGKDWYFYGEPRAKQYLDKINSFYVPIGASNITDGYDLNGAERPQYDTLGGGDTGQSAAFVGPAMVGAMDVAGQAAFVQQAYDNLKTDTLLIGGPYYDQSWTVMSMLFASGNYLNYVPTPTPTPTPDACQTSLRVNAGGTAQSGFSADKAFSAGSWGYVAGFTGQAGTSGGPVTGTPNPGLFLSERYATAPGGELRYDFTVPNGAATVTLHWAETYYTAAAQRRMDVYIEGTLREDNLDLYQAAGGRNVALSRSYNTTVAGGVLNLRFVGVTGEATIHAIEVTSGPLCTPTVSPSATPVYSFTPSPTRSPTRTVSATHSVSPTHSATPTPYPTPDACALVRRVNAGGGTFAGAGGLNWSADQVYSAGNWGYVTGFAGTAGTSAGPIAGTTDDALFTAERWGNPVRYRFDLPNGTYQVRVRLAETYFGTAGQRNVSLSANGTNILNAVDLYTWAGGQNLARDHTFFVTVSTGNLQLETWSSNNNGTFMAIEVIGLVGCTPTRTPSVTPGAPASPTRTPTATPSASPSQTRSPSPTGTVTVTATRTASSTRSASASPSPSPSGSPSLSATPSTSPTPSPTVTRSTSPTPSPTGTRSTSPTPSPTGTLGVNSPTVSATATPSLSATRSETPSPSPTVTPTFTDVPPNSTPTWTPTISPTFSWTGTPTSTLTGSPSASPSVTPSATPTGTPSTIPTGTSTSTPSVSTTSTAGPVVSATRTRTPGNINSLPQVTGLLPNSGPLAGGVTVTVQGNSFVGDNSTAAPTVRVGGVIATVLAHGPSSLSIVIPATFIPGFALVEVTQVESGLTCSQCGSFYYVDLTATPTRTPSTSPTRSTSATPSPTGTRSTSATPSPTSTRSTSATPSPTGTLGAGSPTVSPTASPTLSAPATVPSNGPLVIESHRAWPQPMRAGQGGFISLKLQGSADRIRVRLYTPAMVLVGVVEGPGQGAGWGRLALGPSVWTGLGSGLCYYTVQAEVGSVQSPAVQPGRILLIP